MSDKPRKRPNIVFMIADDHRFSDIHSHHNPLVQTPYLDKLAAGGSSFLNTNIMGGQYKAVCTPTRACVHTGGSVFRCVSNKPEAKFDEPFMNHTEINPKMAFMPEVLKNAGYSTYAVGKWHNDQESFVKGFTGGDNILFGGMGIQDQMPVHRFNPEGVYPREAAQISGKNATEEFCDTGIKFIEQYDSDNPFFLYIAFTSPHDPRTAPKEFHDLYDPANIPLPKNFMPVHPFDNGEMFVRDEGLAVLPRDPYEVVRHIADYYAMISHMDAHMGRVIQAVKDKGIEDDTIIVYTSDHGLSIGQHGLMGKQNLYDHSIRIPLIMRGPGIPANKRFDEITSQMDIFPTLCELSGLPIPETVDGKSMVPLMHGEVERQYDSLFAIYKDVQRMVKTDTYKMIRYYHSNLRETGVNRIQLFNYKEDPWEVNDLAAHPDYTGVVKELSEKLRQWQDDLQDPLVRRPTITFVRHGNTDFNREQRAQGQIHNPLNDTGRAQARRVGERLAEEEWDVLMTSDLLRARETAEIISAAIGVPIARVDTRVREIDKGQITYTVESERIAKWGPDWKKLDLGEESDEAIRKRAVSFVNEVVAKYPGKKVLVVSHGYTMRQLFMELLKDETLAVIENTSVTTLAPTEDGWECLLFNCTKHLDGERDDRRSE
jgi:arylsulfatase A-like enzyme/broad specificity phosphatase PhoE